MKPDVPNDGPIREGEPPYFGDTARRADGDDSDMMIAGDIKNFRRSACWNMVSVSAPFVGFVAGVVAAVFAPHMQWGEWGFRVWFGFAVFGLLAGLISLLRAERWWGVTACGILLNLAVLGVTWDMAIHGR